MTEHPERPPFLRRPVGILGVGIVITLLAALGASAWTGPASGPSTLRPAASPTAPASGGATLTPASPSVTAAPTARPPTPTPGIPAVTPLPRPPAARTPIDLVVVGDPAAPFISEQTKTWCAPAGVEIVLSILGLAEPTRAFQVELAGRIGDWQDRADSLNLGWGPGAMAAALAAYGAAGYRVEVHPTRQAALAAAARAIESTGTPAILLAWRGAHTWVMTGFTADADPIAFPDAIVSGAYILDPWYPRVSSIWGPSDPPGTYQDGAEMVRNFLPWKRPEGRYPDRDGRFVIVVPTIPRDVGSDAPFD
jgi:hypothetical protein